MITKERAANYLATQGIDWPDADLQNLLDLIATIWPCLEENYMPEVAALIALYLLTLLSFATYDKFISSERGPNGASRSYKFVDGAAKWLGVSNMLGMLDTHGCATALVPESPYSTPSAALFIGKAGCMHGGY